MLEKKPFVRYDSDSKRETFTIRLSDEERELLKKMKPILQQEKEGTILKQLAWIGAKVLQRDETAYALDTLKHNLRRNKRIGIVEVE